MKRERKRLSFFRSLCFGCLVVEGVLDESWFSFFFFFVSSFSLLSTFTRYFEVQGGIDPYRFATLLCSPTRRLYAHFAPCSCGCVRAWTVGLDRTVFSSGVLVLESRQGKRLGKNHSLFVGVVAGDQLIWKWNSFVVIVAF